jgi:hypothetical protein
MHPEICENTDQPLASGVTRRQDLADTTSDVCGKFNASAKDVKRFAWF